MSKDEYLMPLLQPNHIAERSVCPFRSDQSDDIRCNHIAQVFSITMAMILLFFSLSKSALCSSDMTLPCSTHPVHLYCHYFHFHHPLSSEVPQGFNLEITAAYTLNHPIFLKVKGHIEGFLGLSYKEVIFGIKPLMLLHVYSDQNPGSLCIIHLIRTSELQMLLFSGILFVQNAIASLDAFLSTFAYPFCQNGPGR